MQIFVKSLEQTFVVTVGDNATVQDLKAAVEDVEFIPAGLQRIVLGTAELEEGSLYPMVKEADTVTLLVGIDGGMRAKWRKKRMRRLRRKRRKMRARAR